MSGSEVENSRTNSNLAPPPAIVNQGALTQEDIVLIAVISLGFLVPLALFLFQAQVPAVLPALLISAAVSALVYRFLGGIDAEGTMTFGLVRVGGSMAALLALGFYLNPLIERQVAGIAAQQRPFEAIVMELGQLQQIGNDTIELLDLGSLPQEKIFEQFDGIRATLKKQYEEWGQKDVPREVLEQVLADLCDDIGSAMNMGSETREKIDSFPKRYFEKDRTINDDWGKIVNILIAARCDQCETRADERKLRQALDLFPFALYRKGHKEDPQFKIATPMTEGIQLGSQYFEVPVFANPQKRQLRRLLGKDETNLKEGIVLLRSRP